MPITIDALLRARDEFERTIQDQRNQLVLADQHLSTEQCPSQQELVPVLRSIQEMSTSLSNFLEILNGVLSRPEERSKLERLDFQETMPSLEATRSLIEPKSVLLRLANSFYKNQIPTSFLWKQTFDLVIWYSEYRETVTSLYYVIESQSKGYFTDKAWLWNWMQDFYDPYRIRTMLSIAERARFLQTSRESEIYLQEAHWWCQQVDSFPRVSTYYDVFIGFLNSCPDAKNPLVIERLKEFALFENSSDNEFVKGQQETIRNKAISLLPP